MKQQEKNKKWAASEASNIGDVIPDDSTTDPAIGRAYYEVEPNNNGSINEDR